MASSRLRHNPREGENVARARPAAQQRPGGGVGCGAGGEHVVHEERAPAVNAALRFGRNAERALEVVRPLRPVRPICGRVGLTRARRNGSTGTPLASETTRASAKAW